MYSLSDIIAISAGPVGDENELADMMKSAVVLADAFDPSLALALRLLADMPCEIAATWEGSMDLLAARLHPDTDGPAICRAVARALAQFAEE